VLLTRAPLYRGLLPFSFDLHVLSAPLTFVLSQDQTLQLNLEGSRPSSVAGRRPWLSFCVRRCVSLEPRPEDTGTHESRSHVQPSFQGPRQEACPTVGVDLSRLPLAPKGGGGWLL
jgi:hypothetical protein